MNGRTQDEMLAEECGLDYDEVTADDNTLTAEDFTYNAYEEWFNENESDILIELAESGADREMDFDLEAEFYTRYQRYCESFQIN